MDSPLRSENLLYQVGSFGERKCSGCGVMDEGCNWAEECGALVLCFCTDCLSSAYEEGFYIFEDLEGIKILYFSFVVGLSSAQVVGSLENV